MRRTQQEVFDILVREHEMALLAFVRSAVDDAAAAEDLVQESFVAAWEQLDEYDESRPFASWVRGIAKNKIREYYRGSAVRGRSVRELSLEALDAIHGEFGQFLSGRGDVFPETLAALQTCLETAIGRSDFDLIERTYRRGDSCRAVAEAIGRSIAVVTKRLQRARGALRDCIVAKLRKEGVQ